MRQCGFPGRSDGEIAIQYLVIQFDDIWVILEREIIWDWRFSHGWGDYARSRGRPYVSLPFFGSCGWCQWEAPPTELSRTHLFWVVWGGLGSILLHLRIPWWYQ